MREGGASSVTIVTYNIDTASHRYATHLHSLNDCSMDLFQAIWRSIQCIPSPNVYLLQTFIKQNNIDLLIFSYLLQLKCIAV